MVVLKFLCQTSDNGVGELQLFTFEAAMLYTLVRYGNADYEIQRWVKIIEL